MIYMSRLKKLSEYTGEYDIDDIINNFDISKLVVSRDSVFESYKDCIDRNKKSQTVGPLGVWITNDNEYVLVDGYHRLIDMLFTGKQYTDIEIWHIGYSDYRYPNDKFEINFSLKWNGLEDICDEEILEMDYEEHYQ